VRLLWCAIGFVLGVITSVAIEILFAPISEPFRRWYESKTSPTLVEFVARSDARCEPGDIGAVLKAARDKLVSRDTLPERLASISFLCATVDISSRPPTQTLSELQQRFPDCFVYEQYATPYGGGKVGPRFSLNLGNGSHICASPLGKDKDTNLWVIKSNLEDGRVFCVPGRPPSGRISQLSTDLRLCEKDDLSVVGFSTEFLSDLGYEESLRGFAR
jgi:hypothetical protein